MKQWIAERKLLVVLTAVAVLMVSLTVLFTLVSAWRSPLPSVPGLDPVTVPGSEVTTTLRQIQLRTQEPMITETESRPTTSPTSPPTTTPVSITFDDNNLPIVPKKYYSHIAVFLDRQIVVMYHTPEEDGEPIPTVAFFCSTGTSSMPTPKPQDKGLKYFTVGDRYRVSKWWSCFVRYPTQFYGDYFFHSIPYELTETGILDKGRMKAYAYSELGKKALSQGCVRLSLRDAKYLSDNSYVGMPVYVYDSSKGHELIAAAPLPPLYGSAVYAGWDPTDPEGPYKNKNFVSFGITYNANGGTGAVPVDKYRYVPDAYAKLMDPPDTLVREGYEFAGWSLKQNPGEGEQLLAPGKQLRITSNMTFYAQWKPGASVPTTMPPETTPTEPSETTPVAPSEPTTTTSAPPTTTTTALPPTTTTTAPPPTTTTTASSEDPPAEP